MAKGSVNDLPLLYRFRALPPSDIDRRQFQTLVVIGWSYSPRDDDSGMPVDADSARMYLLEELLDTALETPGIAYLMVIATGDGRREWQWYTRQFDDFLAALNVGLGGHPPFPIEISDYEDPEWDAYVSIQGAVS